MMKADLTLVHGLYACSDSNRRVPDSAARAKAIAEHGEALGVCDYEWVNGRGRRLANRFLRFVRGTAHPVDAVEIIGLNESAMRASLAAESTRAHWQQTLSCAPYGLDPARSFLLIGTPRQQIEGPTRGQRLLWFGRGLNQLTEKEFIEHYTNHHGPLVASYAKTLGLRCYRQVPDEQSELCNRLRDLELGQANAPPVFAELVMGTPPINPSSLRARRIANREIVADEKRHIDFSHSMLLLV